MLPNRHHRLHAAVTADIRLCLCLSLLLSSSPFSPALAGSNSNTGHEPPAPVEPGTKVTDPASVLPTQADPTWNSAMTFQPGTSKGPDLGPLGIYRLSGIVSNVPAGQTIKITAHVWPNSYAMTYYQGGGMLRPVGEVTVAANGSFDIQLSADPWWIESRRWVNAPPNGQYGYINMQLLLHVGDRSYPLNMPIFVGNLNSLKSADNPATPSLNEAVVGGPEASPNKAFWRTGPNSVHIAFDKIDDVSIPVRCPVGYSRPFNEWHLVETLEPEWAIIGQSFSNTPDVDATFSYERGQESELGLTLIADQGKTIKANVGVTRTFSTSATTTWGTKSGVGDYFYRTKFSMRKYEAICREIKGGSLGLVAKTGVTILYPVSHYGGADTIQSLNRVKASHCAPYEKDGKLEVNKGRAQTWSNGLSLTILGITIGASTQTGYSDNAKILYEAKRGKVQLCGTERGPAETEGNSIVTAARDTSGW